LNAPANEIASHIKVTRNLGRGVGHTGNNHRKGGEQGRSTTEQNTTQWKIKGDISPKWFGKRGREFGGSKKARIKSETKMVPDAC